MTLTLPGRVEAQARLRQKNQLTLPEAIADVLEVEPGDAVVFESDPATPGLVQLHRIRTTFAGALAGVYGTPTEIADYLDEERSAWNDA